ncbi:unnamed protein product [Blepharisma stoltei]|uniref:Uncharacterized protein n=1 Tax=Blepharisma stoltei TaxID=1481888 RepID=A0AAU9JKX6_9CILI|nr:unnamed protein product [Blepharisma stoltei]
MEDFETDAVRSIMSKIYMSMQESDEDAPFHTEVSVLEKPNESTLESIKIDTSQKPAKKVKAEDFVKTTYMRMQNSTKKSQDVLNKVKKQIDKERAEALKGAPNINHKSKKMIGQAVPLQQRISEVILEKERKLEELKEKLNQEREEVLKKDLTFKPQIHGRTDKPRSATEFFKYNEDWANMKAVKEAIKKEELDEKVTQTLKFHPEINQNSEKIMQDMGENRPPEVRLLERYQVTQNKIKAKQEVIEYKFSPEINKKTKQLARAQSAGDVFTRLFTAAESQGTTAGTPRGTKTNGTGFSPEVKTISKPEQPEIQKANIEQLFELNS